MLKFYDTIKCLERIELKRVGWWPIQPVGYITGTQWNYKKKKKTWDHK